MQRREWRPGDVLSEKYRLLAKLGQGGMGSVYRAEHLVLHSPVAIKLIHAWAADDEVARERFLREARAAAALRSPHVVQVLDFGMHEGTPFMAMELLHGESLKQRLGRVLALSAPDTLRIFGHLARAVSRAHEAGIVHRDLKPDNVFLVQDGGEEITKVLDFGVAKASHAGAEAVASGTRTGAVLGTPHYMSPEQARGNRTVDHRSDLWALGVIAFECLAGRRPFESDVLGDLLLKICAEPAPVPSSVAPLPVAFDAWFARATEREPARRFQSAQELVAALAVALGVTNTPLDLPTGPPTGSSVATAFVGPPSQPTPSVTPSSFGALSLANSRTLPRRGISGVGLALVGLAMAALVAIAAMIAIAVAWRARHDDPAIAEVGSAETVPSPPEAPEAPTASSAQHNAPQSARPGGVKTKTEAAKAQTEAAKAQTEAAKAQTEAAKARTEAQEIQDEAAKLRAEAEKARKAARGIP